MNTVLEHTARVLDHQPTRSMHAGALHQRVLRETGLAISYGQFIEEVCALADHFTVIAPDPVVGAAAAWDPRQRSLYEAALSAAGMTQPLVVLAERHVPHDAPDMRGASMSPSEHSPAPGSVLGDMHESLTHLLHATEPDDPLYAAVARALEELHASQHLLAPERYRTRTNTTGAAE